MDSNEVYIGLPIPHGNVNWATLIEDDVTTIKIELGK